MTCSSHSAAPARRILVSLALAASTAAAALAAPCGTVAAPTACSITVGSVVTYTFGNFTLVTANATGGATVYSGADIDIDLATGGGLSALLTFSKSDANPGLVFLANAGQTSAFTISYDVTLSAAAPGTAAYDSTFIVAFTQSNAAADGFGRVQLVVPGAPPCLATVPGGQGNCSIPPQPLTISVGDIASLTGNSGNVSFAGFTNLLRATFAPAPLTPPTVDLAFAPATIPAGGLAALTVTLDNPNGTIASLTSPLVVALPAGVVVAATPNAASTCFGGAAPVAVAGGPSVTLPAGRSIPIGGSCTLTVDVTSNVPGSHVVTLTAGALVTSNGANTAEATAELEVLGAVQPIPTVSEWGLILLVALLAGAGALALRRHG